MWLVESAAGELVVKLVGNPHAAAGEPWRTTMLGALGRRGYPVPERLWHGRLDSATYAIVERCVPGRPLTAMTAQTLDRLLALVDLQAEADVNLAGGFDVSRWLPLVLFEGREGWRDSARSYASMGFYGEWGGSFSPSDGGLPENLTGVICDTGFFATDRKSGGFGLQALAGSD